MQAAFLLFFFALSVSAAAECSLIVKVIDSDRKPVHAFVTVTEHDGRETEKVHEPGTGARFCDLGVKPVQVRVTPISSSCSWAVTAGYELHWNRTLTSTLVVPAGDCTRPARIVPQRCQLLLRVHDEDGKWLANAVWVGAAAQPVRADEYGRILLPPVHLDSLLEGTITAPEHHPKRLQVPCQAAEEERRVELLWDRRGK